MAHDVGAGSLVRAVLGSCPRNDNGKVEDDANRSNAEDDECDGNADPPEIATKCTTEEQQRDLQHQRQ